MFLREGSAERYKSRFPAPARQSEAPPEQEPAPPQPAHAPPEVVGAGVEILPRAPTEVSGNGRTADPGLFAERIDIKDPEERQD